MSLVINRGVRTNEFIYVISLVPLTVG